MRIKTATLSLLLLATGAMPFGVAQAQAKIGVVNVGRLLQESPQAQAASQALEGEFANRRRELETQQKDRKQNEFLEDLNVRRNEVLGQLQRTILQEVQTYAKGAGLDVVVSEALYASPSVDVTQQVLSALQARKGSAPAKP